MSKSSTMHHFNHIIRFPTSFAYVFAAYFAIWLAFSTHIRPVSGETSLRARVYEGFIPMISDPLNPGSLIQATGDVYNRTKCYCRRPEVSTAETHWFGAYFHITYFNWHTKRLFSMEWSCVSSDIDDDYGDTECSPMQDQSEHMRGGYHRHHGCMYAGDKTEHHVPDRWCYTVERQYSHRDQSWFNHQKRKLEYRGRPFYKFQPEVNAECQRLCKEKVEPGLVVLYHWQNPEWPIAGNVIDTFEIMDDMCPECK